MPSVFGKTFHQGDHPNFVINSRIIVHEILGEMLSGKSPCWKERKAFQISYHRYHDINLITLKCFNIHEIYTMLQNDL